MQTIPAKRVDLWDGGDRHKFGFHITADMPDLEIQKVYTHCAITPVVLTVFDTIAEVKENDRLLQRKKALAKLTREDCIALGLIEEPK